MINLILWPVIGALAGLFGGPFIIGGKDSEMNKINTIIGIIGGILGGGITLLIGGGAIGVFSLPCLIFALIGAVILLIISPRQHTLDLLKRKKPRKSAPHSDCYMLKTSSELNEEKRRRKISPDFGS